ncbi:Pectate trisaccharide-lyase precursor [Vibrio aerogenes CECT 7868]|uniref:Pectate trisaccharide-lyase n=1 Tax=Vibrio aerogenes CECT 7868 TaxID=1216006 RepID=A0A1M6A206_9VIBR|nr:hypothetical protein [Vibrio aerogenes]SHI30534.1 Pectate trisaccharide-lyase precursor [Vibrio aerogenes CECT 7868]
MKNYQLLGLVSVAVSSALFAQQASASACSDLINNPDVNWRESSLQTDQEIVQCLASSLGKPVGFGENTTGGYDPNGSSHLVVIKKNADKSVEQQILDAISSEEYNWIVFDKKDFAKDTEVAMYRLDCGEADVLANLDNATEAQCMDHTKWCDAHGVSSDSCDATFFNEKLNDKSLPIRNQVIHSNTTIDGRGANAYFYFNGFQIGSDSKGKSTYQAQNVIVTNNRFVGAGHTEDHELDPDMIRSTGESHDIWIHQNTFEHTGDSAFDVKVGAYDITVSFNKLIDVKRAALHGSSDSRPINAQIKTTIHDNLFVTRDEYYNAKEFDTGRRVPLMRFGQSHMFNNVFYGYRKDILSVRDGGRIEFQNNAFMNSYAAAATKKGDDIEYWTETLLRDFREGGLEITGTYVWNSDSNCKLDTAAGKGDLTASHGTTPDMLSAYGSASKSSINSNMMEAGQDLVDYVAATAGKGGLTPYVSSYSKGKSAILAEVPATCTSSDASATGSTSSDNGSSDTGSNDDSSDTGSTDSGNSDSGSGTTTPSGDNLALSANADGSSKASSKTGYSNAIDGDTSTYWSPSGTTGRISVKNLNTTVNTVKVVELAGSEGTVTSWVLKNHDTGDVLASGSSLSDAISFDAVTVKKLSLYIEAASSTPKIAEFEVYNQ